VTVATTRSYGALAGISAGAVALGVAELVGVLVSSRATPLVAVGGVVIDAVPESGKELAIQLFGTYDKLALLIGTGVLLAGFAALIGVLAIRRRWLGFAGIALLGTIGALGAVTRGGANLAWTLPSLVGAAAGAMVFWLLLRIVSSDSPSVDWPRTAGSERRRFLTATALAIVGAAVVGAVGRAFAQRRSVELARSAVALPTPSGRPATAPAEADVAGIAYTTSNDTFYRINTALVLPQVDPATWTLKIHGRVRRPITLTFDDLIRRPMIERYVTLACVSNVVGGDLIGNARWLGVPVKDLLDEAGPEEGADQVVSRSIDDFTAGTPTAILTDGRDAMIAIGMNGEPLPVAHGFPVRMVVPGLYGYVSATKWLAELELTTFADYDAYWIRRGWAEQAPVKTQSRIDTPRGGTTVGSGSVVVAGVAWAQHRGISKVEVRIDDGAWQSAMLAATVSVDTWRLWSWRWPATPGRHRIQVRATDNAGETQTESAASPFPDGATGWHTIDVSVE
jgi:DMSO/TMAO reductase YedYZ molybdopterin-dependent catalytic subunit